MSEYAKEQFQLEALAKKRRYFKTAADFLAASATKEFADGFITRLKNKKDSLISVFDSAEPTDSLTIARCQAARKICDEILMDFDADSCKKAIEQLDIEIKKIHNTIELKKAKDEETVGGFNSL